MQFTCPSRLAAEAYACDWIEGVPSTSTPCSSLRGRSHVRDAASEVPALTKAVLGVSHFLLSWNGVLVLFGFHPNIGTGDKVLRQAAGRSARNSIPAGWSRLQGATTRRARR